MKAVLFILTCLAVLIAFMHGVDREIARQAYLKEARKPFPGKVVGCIFPANCVYYNKMLEVSQWDRLEK